MTRKVSISRRWLEHVPLGGDGKPIPKHLWPRRRRHCWAVRWFGPDGRRYQITAESKADAERIQGEKMAEFEASPASRNAPRKVTVGEFVDEFISLRIGPRGQRLAPASLTACRQALQTFQAFVGREAPLVNLTGADTTRFLAQLRNAPCETDPERKLAVATVNKTLRSLKAAFNVAVRRLGYIRGNPFASLSTDKVAPAALRYVTSTEFHALINAAAQLDEARRTKLLDKTNEADAGTAAAARETIAEIDTRRVWWQVFVAVCYTAGTRLNEAIHLTWSDIDFEDGTIRIVAKRGGSGKLHEWRPKDKDARVVPIPPMTANLLARLQAGATERHPYVFITKRRFDAITEAKSVGAWREDRPAMNNLRRQWLLIVRDAKIPHATIHDMRRSAITNWGRRLPIHVTQELAGHADVTTTRKFYLSVTKEDMAAARQAAAEAIAPMAR